MAIRVFILPMSEVLVGEITYRAAKYMGGRQQTALPGLENIPYSIQDYGAQPVCILVVDVTATQRNLLSAQADVLLVPVNLGSTLSSSAVTTTQNFLELIFIPAGWITTALTYREVLRKLCWLFQFMQRFHSQLPTKLIQVSSTMDAEFGTLPLATQQALVDSATSLGFSTTGLQSTTTIRVILKNLADQFGDNQIAVGGLDI